MSHIIRKLVCTENLRTWEIVSAHLTQAWSVSKTVKIFFTSAGVYCSRDKIIIFSLGISLNCKKNCLQIL